MNSGAGDRYRSTSTAGARLPGKQAAHRCCYRSTGQTDGRTDTPYRYMDAYRYNYVHASINEWQFSVRNVLRNSSA